MKRLAGFLCLAALVACGCNGSRTQGSRPAASTPPATSSGSEPLSSDPGESAVAAGPAPTSRTARPATSGKKLIEMGWDEPSTVYMRTAIARMEESPFDGCIFHVLYTKPDGSRGNYTWELWGDRAFSIAELQPAIDDLKATRFRRFTDNFLRLNTTPGVDWFSDPSTVMNNLRLGARIARATGCPGVMLDVETYQNKIWDPAKTGRSWSESSNRVREWGRQTMRALQGEYPGIQVLLTWSYSFLWHETRGRNITLQQSEYGLLVPFLDGMFETAEGATRLIDGHELSYRYRDTTQFRRARTRVRSELLPLVADPQRYQRHGGIAFAVWVDYDWRERGWDTVRVDRNSFTPAGFEQSVIKAIEHSDRYAWLYTEQPRWWTQAGGRRALPSAYVDAVWRARRATGLP